MSAPAVDRAALEASFNVSAPPCFLRDCSNAATHGVVFLAADHVPSETLTICTLCLLLLADGTKIVRCKCGNRLAILRAWPL